MKRFLIGMTCLLLIGCGGQNVQFSKSGKSMLNKFKQQIERKNMKAAEQLCEQARQLNGKGTLNDDEYAEIETLCGKISSSRWDEAKEIVDGLLETKEE